MRLSALKTLLGMEPVEGRLRAMNALGSDETPCYGDGSTGSEAPIEMLQTGQAEQAVRALGEELRLANNQPQ